MPLHPIGTFITFIAPGDIGNRPVAVEAVVSLFVR